MTVIIILGFVVRVGIKKYRNKSKKLIRRIEHDIQGVTQDIELKLITFQKNSNSNKTVNIVPENIRTVISSSKKEAEESKTNIRRSTLEI